MNRLKAILLTVLLISGIASARTWTATDGRTLEADFVELKGDNVILKKQGKNVEIPMNRLSEGDRKWLEDKAKEASANSSKLTVEEVSEILKNGLDAQQDEETRKKVAAFFKPLLPTKGFDGEEMEWEVDYMKSGNDFPLESLIISAKMNRKKDDEEMLWVHILYNREKAEFEAQNKLLGYGVMRMENRHAFIDVNKFLDFRLVTSHESYQDDAKIEAILKATDLKAMEKL